METRTISQVVRREQSYRLQCFTDGENLLKGEITKIGSQQLWGMEAKLVAVSCSPSPHTLPPRLWRGRDGLG